MGPRREWRSRAREGRARSRRDRSGSVPRSVEFRVEIGSVPRRDRFSSASRSVRRRRARGPGPRGGHFGARWAFRRESDGGVVGLAPKCRPRRERGRAPAGVVPPRAPDRAAPGPTSTAGSYPTPHGRTQIHEVVPGLARSYLKAPLQYDPAPQRTTTRIHVRPHEPGYDRPEATAAGPVGRTTARATAPPHNPPTAPDPTRPITPTPRPRPPTPTASRTARPSDNHHPPPAPPRTTPPHNHDNEPNSSRNRTELDGEDRESTAARRPPCGGRRAAVTRTRAATA